MKSSVLAYIAIVLLVAIDIVALAWGFIMLFAGEPTPTEIVIFMLCYLGLNLVLVGLGGATFSARGTGKSVDIYYCPKCKEVIS
jgi:hypothetical protein